MQLLFIDQQWELILHRKSRYDCHFVCKKMELICLYLPCVCMIICVNMLPNWNLELKPTSNPCFWDWRA